MNTVAEIIAEPRNQIILKRNFSGEFNGEARVWNPSEEMIESSKVGVIFDGIELEFQGLENIEPSSFDTPLEKIANKKLNDAGIVRELTLRIVK
jgi:hypothetical protein